MGALLNVHGTDFRTNVVEKDGPWKRVEVSFNSGELTVVSINCLFGGWGHSKGTALFDDVELTASAAQLPGLVGRVSSAVINHYAHRAPVDSVVGTLSATKSLTRNWRILSSAASPPAGRRAPRPSSPTKTSRPSRA